MSIDLNSLFGDAKSAAQQGMNDLLQQGGNAGLGFLEQKAIDIISADKADKEKAVQAAVASSLAKPSAAGSFSAYMSNLASGPAIKQYGPYILIAVAVIVAGTLAMRGRK